VVLEVAVVMLIKNPVSILFSILFGLALILPSILQPLKAVLLIIIYGFLIVSAKSLLKRLSLNLYFLSFFYGSFGLLWSFYGLIDGNPGALRVLTVMTIYPIALPFLTVLYQRNSDYSLHKLFIIFLWVLVILDFLYILLSIEYPNNFLVTLIHSLYSDVAAVDSDSDYFKFTIPNVSTLVFMIPYIVSAVFFKNNNYYNKGLTLLFLLVLILGVLSGRRAIFVTAFLGPIVAFTLTVGANTKSKISLLPKLITLSLMILSLYVAVNYVNINFFVDQANSIFNFTTNESNLARIQQYDSLWRGIDAHPLFGSGAGAASDVSRSSEMPWAYELFYLAIVFQYGFIGFSFYLFGVALIFYFFIKIIKIKGRKSFEFYFFSGFISFMLATATNPYLAKFDYMWVIFIPFAVISNYLYELQQSSNRVKDNI
jgi:O-antigen ligase